MTTLDCSTLDSALDSLAPLLGLTVDTLRARLRAISPRDRAIPKPHIGWEPRSWLWEEIVGRSSAADPTEAIWFHGTRILETTTFAEGLLPLSLAFPGIVATLEALELEVSEEDIARHAKDPVPQSALGFGGKLHSEYDQGPFAFLVRDALTARLDTNHDYLAVPEIVEDYAAMLGPGRCGALIERFQRATVPAIVAFRSTEGLERLTLPTLSYCYKMIWGLDLDIHDNTMFDGEGRPIPYSAIIAIDHLSDTAA